jgi:hypothetical protein
VDYTILHDFKTSMEKHTIFKELYRGLVESTAITRGGAKKMRVVIKMSHSAHQAARDWKLGLLPQYQRAIGGVYL